MATQDSDDRSLGELLAELSADVKAVARDQVALARAEIGAVARVAARDAAIMALGSIVGLIGFGMLCAAAVAGLEPLIAPLWARLLIMAGVYLAGGGTVAAMFVRRLQNDVSSGLERTRDETAKTVETVKEALNA
jgi:hypothetical protein